MPETIGGFQTPYATRYATPYTGDSTGDYSAPATTLRPGYFTPYRTVLGTMYAGIGLVAAIPDDVYTPVVFEVDFSTYLTEALSVPVWAGILPPTIKPGDLPGLVYNLVGSEQEEELEGSTDIECWSIQVDSYGNSRLDAATLSERVRSKILGFVGMMGAVEVLNVTLEPQSHSFEPTPNGSGKAIHRRMATYSVWFRQSIPRY